MHSTLAQMLKSDVGNRCLRVVGEHGEKGGRALMRVNVVLKRADRGELIECQPAHKVYE